MGPTAQTLNLEPPMTAAVELIEDGERKGPFDLDTISPRVRLAARLYATGAAKTKKEASEMAGLHPNYLTLLTGANGSEKVKSLINDVDAMIEDESIATSKIIQRLGRKALGRLANLMDSENEHVALKAAVDLADRAPETSKTQKIQVESLTLDGTDVRALTQAMLESAREREKYSHVAVEGLVEVEIDKPAELPFGTSSSEHVPEQSDG